MRTHMHPSSHTLRNMLMAICMVCFSAASAAESLDYSIVRGGLLYDKWFKENHTSPPAEPHPAYPETGKYRGKKGADWRCKECHGWDYRGADGAYGQGGHKTGIKGIRGMEGKPQQEIIAILKDKTHAYGDGMLSEKDLLDLANFVSLGQVEMDNAIQRDNKQGKGDLAKGQPVYETVCARCHGLDGKEIEEMPPIGKVANENPWEVLHKILNGHPGHEMPALRVFGIDTAADVLTYSQTLPAEE